MKECPISELPTTSVLDGYIFHKSGTLLHKPGEQLTSLHIAFLEACEITSVIFTDATTDPPRIADELSRKRVPLSSITSDIPLPAALFDSNGTCIAREGEPLSALQRETLTVAGTEALFYRKDPMELGTFQTDRYRIMLESDMLDSFVNVPKTTAGPLVTGAVREYGLPDTPPGEAIPDDRCFMQPARSITVTTCKEMMQYPDQLVVAVPGYPKPQTLNKILAGRSRETALAQNSYYQEWAAQLGSVFATIKNNKATDFSTVETVAAAIIAAYCTDCFYCLNLMNLRHPPTSERYLQTHSLNVGIATAAVGHATGYQSSLLRELVVGALLHDIGHLLTYRPFLAQKDFSPSEQQKYDNHTVVGMAMLKNMTKVPVSTMLVVAQHHEKLDGSGRIFHAQAAKIHDFAKIVAAVDFFETRSRFMTMSAALASAVVEAQKNRIDIRYVKTLVVTLSLYPIGVAVQTAKGQICKVIATNDQSFKTPVLKSLYTMNDEHLFPLDTPEIIDTNVTPVVISKEVVHSALKSDIITGFIT